VPEGRTTLGLGGQNNLLGRTTVLGRRVWMQDAAVLMRVGPLDAAAFEDFLPGGSAHVAMSELTRLYAGPDIDARLQLVVSSDDVTAARLGSARLGWSSWLRFARGPVLRHTTPPEAAADDQVHVRLTRRRADVRP
jgi:type VI secretion system protein ImpH